jgi:ribonuclease PH
MSRRKDARTATELRGLSVDFGSLAGCDGSARLRCGETDVVVGVQGPRPPKAIRYEDATGCLVEVLLQPAYGQLGESVFGAEDGIAPGNAGCDPQSCCGFAAGPKEKEMEGLVRDAVGAVVAKSAMPRTVLTIVVQILHDGGSLLSAIINCCSLALVDAGVPLIATLTAAQAVGSVIRKEEGDSISVDLEALLLDPTKEEELREEKAKVVPAVGSSSSASAASATNAATTVITKGKVVVTQVSAWRGDRFSSLFFRSVGAPLPLNTTITTKMDEEGDDDDGDDQLSNTTLGKANTELLRNAAATVLAFHRLAVSQGKISKDSVHWIGESAAISASTTNVTITTSAGSGSGGAAGKAKAGGK